ncbi:hypothetical protein [Aquabacter spiritensis]|uniref:Uncharacterized protein n=1 Tax=Aquabacter spiritensis TaxID=933073 RepID=A0A4R3M363_9HYPH|nr:hypothetical protein [Aquabacter spiritensis]TCT07610.1 hypothetical protein EDC64_101129 [Aquabacter spiritensis]
MERILGRIFLIFVLILLTFVFYLQVNSLGMYVPLRAIMSWEKRQDEIDCYYFTGVHFQKVTYHTARQECPPWIDIY